MISTEKGLSSVQRVVTEDEYESPTVLSLHYL